ncbi:VOC family protein [Actinomycetospora soli]|uniref:VOC family protein n=1 Tax=Actinomycetospora soli TaxID=2893887 RepID=UPI001E2EFB0D|nr:VOC family protein [Actinomycetospora soli]MCD2190315.1 VOC family protein [Actinomycetospora soli]
MSSFEGSRIDHLNLPVTDLDRAVAFHTAALAPLGIEPLITVRATATQKAMQAFGVHPKPFFWVVAADRPLPYDDDTHLAFTAPDHGTVDAFHAAALAAGAESLRGPGLWPEYHADYYGAFVRTPDGVNLEAVCHRAP